MPTPTSGSPVTTSHTTVIIIAVTASVGGVSVTIAVVACLWCVNSCWMKGKKGKGKRGKRARMLNEASSSKLPLHDVTHVRNYRRLIL